jgi:3-(3-hydroxy-phenyl)propionate hydroxylase
MTSTDHPRATAKSEAAQVWPVLVVGAGPTGLMLAKRGVKVCLVDQLEHVVQEARAVSIDDESLRSLADAQVLEGFLPQITLSYGVHYYSWRQRLFAKV